MDILFIIAFLCSLILSLIVSRLFYKSFITPITFFSVIWSLVGILANLELYGYYQPSYFVNWVILIGNLVFTIFFVIFFRKPFSLKINSFKNSSVNIQNIQILNLICFVIILPYFIRSLSIISSSGFVYLRSVTGDTELGVIGSSLMSNVIESLIKPVIVATSVLSTTIIFTDEEKKEKIIIVLYSSIGIFLYSLLNASRILIVNYIFYFVISFLLFYKKTIINFIVKEKFKTLLIIVLILFLLFMQNARSSDMSILETFYIYYVSGPAYLSQIINDSQAFDINNEFLWGSATFGFLSNVVSNFLILLTGEPQGTVYLLGSVLTNKQYAVSPSHLVNAMSTVYYNFLLDWGSLGVLIGPIILAGISAFICNKAMKEKNIFYSSLLVFWLNVLIRTIFKWDLLGIDFIFIVLALSLFTNNNQFNKGDVYEN